MKNLKIGKKILLLLSLAVVSIIAVGVTGFIYMNQLAQNSEDMYDHRLLPLQYIDQIKTNNRALDSYTLEYILNENSSVTKELLTSTQEKEAETRELIASFRDASNTQANQDLITQFEKLFDSYIVKV
ncbi:MAG: MCP four helix bundle domain-containing protein, partial [Paenisporosarcina sp.]